MDESPCEPGDWEQIDVWSTPRDIQDKCEEKGLWGVDVQDWHTTTKPLTAPGPDVRALVARWTESDRDSIVRIIKEGSKTRYLENPDLDESKCVFIVLGQRETFLIVGPLRMQYVRKKLSRILH